MTTTAVASYLKEIFDRQKEKCNVKVKNMDSSTFVHRSVVIEVPNANFSYGFIWTKNGIEEIDDVRGFTPTVRAILPYEVLAKLLRKQMTIYEAIYSGLVQIKADNPQLHINILLAFFSDI
jgi:hypothetical protein